MEAPAQPQFALRFGVGSVSVVICTSEAAILTIRDVADYLKVNERTIYRLAGAKQVPAFKVGGSWRFSTADIEAWIRDQNALKKAN